MAVDPKAEIAGGARAKPSTKVAPEQRRRAHLRARAPASRPSHGDYSSSVALQLAKQLKTNPRELAQTLSSAIRGVSAAGHRRRSASKAPGFINFRLKQRHQDRRRPPSPRGRQALTAARARTSRDIGPGRVRLGQSRPGRCTSATAARRRSATRSPRCIEAQGDKVTREFYYNDAGAQIENLALSVQARARGIKPGDAGWPEDGYAGEYIEDIARRLSADRATTSTRSASSRWPTCATSRTSTCARSA